MQWQRAKWGRWKGGARGTFKEWQRKLTQSCSAWQCRLKSNGFEEHAEGRWGMCSSYLAIWGLEGCWWCPLMNPVRTVSVCVCVCVCVCERESLCDDWWNDFFGLGARFDRMMSLSILGLTGSIRKSWWGSFNHLICILSSSGLVIMYHHHLFYLCSDITWQKRALHFKVSRL